MKKLIWILPTLVVAFFSLSSLRLAENIVKPRPEYKISPTQSVSQVLEKLGDASLAKPDFSMKGVSAERGADLFLRGITVSPSGGKTSRQSKHFVCTSCHNIVREDPDLSVSDPQAKLLYAQKNNLPFLQGTAMYGAVNRTSFYNQDYFKKYGKLVYPAQHNIREAIQLCAIECSQGRRVKDWEIESILAYLWTIDLKLNDLNLSSKETAQIESALSSGQGKDEAIKVIKSHYLAGSPATFTLPPDDWKKGYGLTGNAENGKLIYNLSCKHCHEDKKYSYFLLDDSRLTFKHLNKHLPNFSRYSIYQVGRWGTPPMNGKRAYMPQYTAEKMSNQQMEDLRAYIEEKSKNG